jgi:hypothetical protein
LRLIHFCSHTSGTRLAGPGEFRREDPDLFLWPHAEGAAMRRLAHPFQRWTNRGSGQD